MIGSDTMIFQREESREVSVQLLRLHARRQQALAQAYYDALDAEDSKEEATDDTEKVS